MMVASEKLDKEVENNLRFLKLLANRYPTIRQVGTEIINLQAIQNLPKGTEHFVADIHGEYEAFQHILRNASGDIKRKVKGLLGNRLTEEEIKELCTLIYYPEKKLELIHEEQGGKLSDDFYKRTLSLLIEVCRMFSSKYSRSKVRKTLPEDFSYIIEELLHVSEDEHNKERYVQSIVSTIIEIGQADEFIAAIADVIHRLAVDHLHILGDIFDRGPGAHTILDMLLDYRHFDIQWGNHDALWMGAASGNNACIANVLRVSLRYGNMATLEDGYGINLLPLATFAMQAYAEDPCTIFAPKIDKDDVSYNEKRRRLVAQMHKAISVIQFKLEAQLIDKHPEWNMQDRKLFHCIDFNRWVITIDGKEYPMQDTFLPTVDPKDPYKLSPEEEDLVNSLHHSFCMSDKLHRHMDCLLLHGNMYGIYNNNLLFHASVPMDEKGELREVEVHGHKVKGKALLHYTGMIMRSAFNQETSNEERDYAIDYFWYLWCGPESPLFDKSKMTTFERYFVADKETHNEEKGWYYKLRDNAEVVDHILDEFGIKGTNRHIINGHVPVKAGKGENPIKAGGKLMVIDGGFSRAYHKTTGIAGYTLVFHSKGFALVQHEPFTSAKEAVIEGTDIRGTTQIVEMSDKRMLVKDTDTGAEIAQQIQELQNLLYAYRRGILKENK